MVENFNDNWFLISESGKKRPIDVPKDLMLSEKRYKNSPNRDEGSYFSGGIYHYQKIFDVDVSASNDYYALHFHGVYKKAIVIINGKTKRVHKNGFSDFYVEFEPLKHNVIDVIADNSLIPNCRWYTGSGIYRDVELIHKKKNEIHKIFVKTIDYKEKIIEVLVDTKEKYTYEIFDGNGLLYKGSEKEIKLPDASLWSLDNPKLYRIIVKTEFDEVETRFGIRKIEGVSQKGLFLNGERIILKGACIHSDNEFLGAASFKDIEYKKVMTLKNNGFNAIRASHNPTSKLFLDVCDEVGMLVIDEAFDGWFIPKNYHDNARIFDETYEETITQMVKKDLNHPSVIMYSFGNELSEIATEKGLKILKNMHDLVKQLDDTRYTTCGINLLVAIYYKFGIGVYKDKGNYEEKPLEDLKKGHKEKKNGSSFFNAMMQKLGWLLFLIAKSKMADKIATSVANIVDIIGLNYGTTRYEIDSKKYPNRLMYGSETMIKHINLNYESSFKYPNVIGDFIWSGIDYLGEATSNDYRYYSYKGLPLLAGAGSIDFSYKNNAEMGYIDTVWKKSVKPKIYLSQVNHYNEVPYKSAWRFTNSVPSYNFEGFEGKRCEVEIYSSAYKIKLLINGKEIGTKKIKDFKVKFKTKYKKGVIEAIALDKNDKELDRSKLGTGKKKILDIKLSKDVLSVSNKDILILEMEFVDENGAIYPTIEIPVKIKTSDNLKLIGLGSAITVTNESYLSDTFTTYQGRLVAFIKALNDKKNIGRVEIQNKICETKIVKVEVKP